MAYRILIAEDEPRLLEVMCDYFISKGDDPVPVSNGTDALERTENEAFDAILLDIMMPGLDGFSVCRAVRRHNDVPIIFLTALSDEDDKLYGYELGADDYITKPFSLSVLYAKVTALIRRSRGSIRQDDRLEAGGISCILSQRRVFAGKKEISLTPKEYSLLVCLMRNRNIVMSREQLLVKCWGYDYDGEARAVDTHIKRLREKLGEYASCIKTVIKAGYVLEVQ
ncbi:MAG: response regulator transcription factor [Clostridia bacterium]|nr:response regulator transcription factor [Clostridia bacterium]MBQ2327061.1 response regulator transcription factor [Clostridia bacterium]MBQ5813014.1 response regulator transcription factor [Clostridia bacterium]